MKKLFTILLVVLGLCATAHAGPVLQLGGRVIRVTYYGGETTGYALRFGGSMTINGVSYTQLDIDPNGIDMRTYTFRLVNIIGELVFRHGTERGDYPVVVISTIQRVHQGRAAD